MEVNGESVDSMSPSEFQAMMVRLSLSLSKMSPISLPPPFPLPSLSPLSTSLPTFHLSHSTTSATLSFSPSPFPPSPLTSSSLLPPLPPYSLLSLPTNIPPLITLPPFTLLSLSSHFFLPTPSPPYQHTPPPTHISCVSTSLCRIYPSLILTDSCTCDLYYTIYAWQTMHGTIADADIHTSLRPACGPPHSALFLWLVCPQFTWLRCNRLSVVCLTAKQLRVGGDQGGASFPGERGGH